LTKILNINFVFPSISIYVEKGTEKIAKKRHNSIEELMEDFEKQFEKKIMIGIIMGSKSDLPVMQAAVDIMKEFGIAHEVTVVSAHRTPLRMVEYAQNAHGRGLKVIIAGAGGAAHLPGMVASLTTLPVIGVPVKSSNSIDGWDSILSILQMPGGVPVATVALNSAKNAGLLAAEMLGIADEAIHQKLVDYKQSLIEKVNQQIKEMEG
jgi:5-(carboxyamino)imidazole ribonucleotide mutase